MNADPDAIAYRRLTWMQRIATLIAFAFYWTVVFLTWRLTHDLSVCAQIGVCLGICQLLGAWIGTVGTVLTGLRKGMP